jgi:SAM-dependent methyltransferase
MNSAIKARAQATEADRSVLGPRLSLADGDTSLLTCLEKRQVERGRAMADHFDQLAEHWDRYLKYNAYYHRSEHALFRTYIQPGATVLELGCATGNLLASVQPAQGIGVDISRRMIAEAVRKHPHLTFVEADAVFFDSDLRFDYIIVNRLLEYLADIQGLFQTCSRLLKPRGRLLVSTLNPLWSLPVRLAAKCGLAVPDTDRNFVTGQDTTNLLNLAGFEVQKTVRRTLLPKKIPLLSSLVNFIAAQIPGVRRLCMTEFLVARPTGRKEDYSVSVVVPCYNEAGNIADCVRRLPPMGRHTELIVVDDGSKDGTAEQVRPELNPHVEVRCISYQPNRGKLQAVLEGFRAARGDILMILDADMTVPPEDLPYFYQPLRNGQADFVNGTRLIYPMASGSMKFRNFLGNKLFGLLVSWLTDVKLSDTLCGTKAFFAEDFPRFNVGNDPWGDFDWLFSAAQLSAKILEVPIRYEERRAGRSKMKALKHSWALLKACWSAFWRIKYPRSKVNTCTPAPAPSAGASPGHSNAPRHGA